MDKAKENWIEHYIFVSGQEAERAWAERHAPKPATPEPPELPPLGEQFMLDGRPYVVTGVVQSAPSTPEEIIDRVTDAISGGKE